MTATVHGTKSIEQMLRELPRSVQSRLMREAMTPALDSIVAEARARAPKSSGKGAMRIRRKWKRGNKGMWAAGVGVYAKSAYYMRFPERGTEFQPAQNFLARSLLSQQSSAVSTIQKILSRTVPREAERIAKQRAGR